MKRIIVLAVLLGACAGEPPAGLAPTKRAGGPVVRWDLQHKPLPEIPLPNDAATRLDPTSPTGRRVNVSLLATTFLESDLRAKADRLTGFGIFMPLTVGFDKPLDLANIIERQSNTDVADDVAWLVNIDEQSPGFGERIPLDFGGGAFPLVLEKTNNYFDNDPRSDSMNLLFEAVQEDRNCNGTLDPGEDTDNDGKLDRPNVHGLEWHEDANCNGKLDPGEDWDCDGELDSNLDIVDGLHEDMNCNGVLDVGEDVDCDGALDKATGALTPAAGDTNGDLILDEGETWSCAAVVAGAPELARGRRDAALADHLTTFYEQETDTLVMRPIMPLREHTTYAALLTKRLVGRDGKPVESPFPQTSHAAQTPALAALPAAAKKAGISVGDVVFAWTYTTGSVTWEMEAIRAGLYGHGPFARLADEFPVETFLLDRLRDDNDPQAFIARYADFEAPLGLLAVADGLGSGALPYLDSVSHLVVGTFQSPYFLVDRNGLAMDGYPADDDEVFDMDATTGEARVGPGTVTFWCAIPKTVPGLHEQPFPVEIFGHGYGSSKFEVLPQMGRMAKFGIAACALDAVGHGTGPAAEGTIDLGSGEQKIRDVAYSFFHQVQLGNFVLAALKGRDRDLDNDGIGDPGGDFWTADTFHTRDIVRQSVVDHLQFVRMVRAFDGTRTSAQDTNGDGFGDLLGDFDGDGVVDMGGPGVKYAMWGSSLGGILTGILAGLEPALDAAASHAGGAGLLDIALRSRQGGVPEAVFLPLLGPIVSFNPVPETNPAQTELTMLVNNVARTGTYAIARTTAIAPGDRVVLKNLRNGEVREATVPGNRRFRLAVAADALSATQKRRLLGYGPAPHADDALVPGAPQGVAAEPSALPVPKDPAELGDPLLVEIWGPGGTAPKKVIDTFGLDVAFQGALHPAGSPLVALSSGFGFQRNSPELRRFTGIASMILQSADPVGYAPHYWREPLKFPYDDATPGANMLVLPMSGDMNVPVNTEIMMAVAAGTVTHEGKDPRYGKSQLQMLIDNHVMEGLERLWRFDFQVDIDADKDCELEGSVRRLGSFDADDVDEGTSEYHAPSPELPLRATVTSAGGKAPEKARYCNESDKLCGDILSAKGGLNAMRIAYTSPEGAHDLPDPNPCRKFDVAAYYFNLVAYWFHTGGTVLPDHLCLARESCEFFPWE